MLRRLEWTVLRPLDGLLPGQHRTFWRGHGLELADLRLYQPGDDPRHIDWNLTARTGEPHVRLFAEERELAAWFLVDLSGSVAPARDGGPRAETVATGFVAVLASVLARQGCRVGALIYRPQAATAPRGAAARDRADARRGGAGEGARPARADAPAATRPTLAGAGIEPVPPGAGRRQVLRLLQALRAPVAAPAPHATELARLLDAAAGSIPRRSLVFVVSDFLGAPGWQAPLGRLARRHDLMAVRVTDATDALLPGLGWVRFEDAETGEQLAVDTDAPGFAARLAALAAERDTAITDALAAAGADTLELAAGDDLLDALLRCIALRQRRPPGLAPRRWHKVRPPGGAAPAVGAGASAPLAPAQGAPR
nr:DUF58 domain-containing protein [Derxia gummosa]